MIPTSGRPYMARCAALQLACQTRVPDIVCFHQNGHREQVSYERQVSDVRLSRKWIHTPYRVDIEEWYSKPLSWLLDDSCDAILYCDDDDVYYSDHVERTLRELDDADLVIRNRCSVLKTVYAPNDSWCEFIEDTSFTAHADAGVSSSMAFSRRFAVQLLADLEKNLSDKRSDLPHHSFPDEVVHRVTASRPEFHVRYVSAQPSTMAYVVHAGSCTSNMWI